MPTLPQIGPPSELATPGTFPVPQENPAVQGMNAAFRETRQTADNVIQGVRRLQVQRQATQADSDLVRGIQDIEQSTWANPTKMAAYYSNPDPVAARKAFMGDVEGQITNLKTSIAAQNKQISLELAPQLNIRANEGLMRLGNRFLAEYDQNARDAFTGTAMQSSALAAVGSGGLNLQTGEPANDDVKHEMARYLQSLKTAPGILPNEKLDTAIKYHQMIATMSLQQLVTQRPEDVLAMKETPAGVPPEELERAQTQAITRLTFGWRQTEAAVKQEQNANDQKILAAEAAGNHQMAVDLSNQYMPFHRMSNDIYRVINGRPYEDPSDPGYKAIIEDSLAGMTRLNADEVEHQILLGKEGMNPSLNKRDFAYYSADFKRRKAQLNDDFVAADKTMRATIVNAVDEINKGEYTTDKIDRAGTLSDWDAAVARAKTPADLLEARNAALERIEKLKLGDISAGANAEAVMKMKAEMNAWLHRYEAVGLPPVPLRTSIYKTPGLGNSRTALPPMMGGKPVEAKDIEGVADTIRALENPPGEEWRKTPVSSAGAIGPYQIMPATAKFYGIPMDDLMDENKARAAVVTKILPDLAQRFHGNKYLMLAAYNAGPGAVMRTGGDLTKLPQETRNYVLKALGMG